MVVKEKVNREYLEEKIFLDFLHSNRLTEIEKGIKETINGVILSKKAICIALAYVKIKELYKQININSFKEYLKIKRIPFNYSTALDYSIIGEMLIKYENELKNVNFKEETGLQKLLLLEKGLHNYKDQPQIVFEKIREISFRDFKAFVNNNNTNNNGSKRIVKKQIQDIQDFSIKTEDERVFLLPFGLDVLWLNGDIEEKLGIPGLYKQFRKYIIKSVKDFFNQKGAL